MDRGLSMIQPMCWDVEVKELHLEIFLDKHLFMDTWLWRWNFAGNYNAWNENIDFDLIKLSNFFGVVQVLRKESAIGVWNQTNRTQKRTLFSYTSCQEEEEIRLRCMVNWWILTPVIIFRLTWKTLGSWEQIHGQGNLKKENELVNQGTRI